MHSAEQASIGGRKQGLEDGGDVCNSESDSDSNDHGSEIKDAYQGIPTDSHGDPLGASHRVLTEQANAMRASDKQVSSQASRMDPPLMQERKATPLSSNDDEQPLSFDQWREIQHAKKLAARPLEKSSQANEGKHTMTTRYQSKMASRAEGLRSLPA
jgi:hypothetical protein